MHIVKNEYTHLYPCMFETRKWYLIFESRSITDLAGHI